MKKLLTTLAILTATLTQAQRTNINILGSKNTTKVEVERLETNFYYKAQIEYSFSEKYRNIGFGLGYTTAIGKFEPARFYTGGKIGIIQHDNQGGFVANATVGAETGVDYHISENIAAGVRYAIDWREDLKFYGVNNEASLKGGLFLKLSIKIK